jgi:hypothetical protein
MWEPRRLTTLWAFSACYRNTFAFFFFIINNPQDWCTIHIFLSDSNEPRSHPVRGKRMVKANPRDVTPSIPVLSCWFVAWLTPRHWRWMKYVPAKHRLISTRLYLMASQKMVLSMFIAKRAKIDQIAKYLLPFNSECRYLLVRCFKK